MGARTTASFFVLLLMFGSAWLFQSQMTIVAEGHGELHYGAYREIAALDINAEVLAWITQMD